MKKPYLSPRHHIKIVSALALSVSSPFLARIMQHRLADVV
jgi:hypothetical protein